MSASTSKNNNITTDIISSGGGSGNANLKRSLSEMKMTSSSGALSGAISGGGGGIDTHPYQRGSVIEVLYTYGPMNMADGDSDMDEDFEDVDEGNYDNISNHDDDVNNKNEESHDKITDDNIITNNDKDNGISVNRNDNENQNKNHITTKNEDAKHDQKTQPQPNKSEIRLADIIDRCQSSTPNHPIPAYRYKYYIHYRDYNRRMDEWITDPLRIVSPPSVGNAKVREMKKRMKKLAMKEEEVRKEKERLRLLQYVNAGGGGIGNNGNLVAPAATNKLDINLASNGCGSGKEDGINLKANLFNDNLSISPGGRVQRVSSRRAIAAITNSSSNLNNNNINNGTADSKSEDGNNNARQRRKSTRGGITNGSDINNGIVGQQNDKNSSRPISNNSVITTFLPAGQDDIITDKVVTVAARELDEHEGLDEASLREHEEVTKVKNVAEVQLGKYRMNAWYFSPIPKELFQSGNGNSIDVLYVCEFTLNFFARKEELLRYQAKILTRNERHPPGNEIYRNGNLSMFEIDGFEERIYCQNLCYIAKLFLDHKTLYFDVDPFLFYVLCEVDERGFHPVGYYSKEKYSDVGFNLACILTFPCHQRKGYGRFLIDFSYELSKKEEKVGSPEKPMSDLGQQAYKPYWTSTLVDFLLNQNDCGSISIMDISKKTSIMAEDIIFTLNVLGLLKYINGVYFIAAEKKLLQELAKKHPLKEPRVDPSKLHWSPYLSDVKRDKFSIHSKRQKADEGGSNR